MSWRHGRGIRLAWHIDLGKLGDLSWIGVTDSPAVMVADLVNLLNSIFEGFPFLTMSQMRRYHRGEKDGPEEYARGLMDKFGLRAAVTRGLGDSRELSAEEMGFAVHVSGPPRMEWLREVIWFGDWSLPTIAYATHYPIEPWPDKLLEQNAKFVSWFRLKVSDEVLRTLVQPSDLLFWIADGDPSFAFPDPSTGEEIQTKIRELASQVGLEPVFSEPIPQPEPGCLAKIIFTPVLLFFAILAAFVTLLYRNKHMRAMLRRLGFYYEKSPDPPADLT